MKSKVFFLAAALMFLAVPMFAQTSGGGSNPAQWKGVTAGFAMAIASARVVSFSVVPRGCERHL